MGHLLTDRVIPSRLLCRRLTISLGGDREPGTGAADPMSGRGTAWHHACHTAVRSAPTNLTLTTAHLACCLSAQPPPRLPPPPGSSSLLEVGPYLLKLALSERNLWWRLAAALALMILSKAAGAPADGVVQSACVACGPQNYAYRTAVG